MIEKKAKMSSKKKLLISILVFDGVEELDFIGPLEVFGMASRLSNEIKIQTITLGQTKKIIHGTCGLKFMPYTADLKGSIPDLCVIPGGRGARMKLNNKSFLKWVEKCVSNVPHILSVCTGSLVLAKLGLLRNCSATTHLASINDLKKIEPSCRIKKNVRFVDSGRIVTSAGVSAGIDAALYLLESLAGKTLSNKTSKRMEYFS